MESEWRFTYSLSREVEIEIVFPEGGAKRQPDCLPEPCRCSEFHEQHGRQGLGLTQEGLTQSLWGAARMALPSVPTPPHPPDNQAATLLGWARGCLKQLYVSGALERIGMRGRTKNAIKCKSTDAAWEGVLLWHGHWQTTCPLLCLPLLQNIFFVCVFLFLWGF